MQAKPINFVGHSPSGSGDLRTPPSSRTQRRIFLLSPANVNSARGRFLLGESGKSVLWHRLREGSASLGEVFTFISGLYFRGKLAYACAFADPPDHMPRVVVITASGGLVPPEKLVTVDELQNITAGRVDADQSRYRIPLERDARLLQDHAGPGCEFVLLGSIATPKYIDPLLGIFQKRLVFPAAFVGRGDMSRGGLLLQCVREQKQLTYVPVDGAVRHGVRPPRLGRPNRRAHARNLT